MQNKTSRKNRGGGESCRSCRFWDEEDDRTGLGECKALPPSIGERFSHERAIRIAVWPYTIDISWCGGYEQISPETRLLQEKLEKE